MKLLLLSAALSLLAAGCAVEGAPFEKAAPQPNEQVVYVYRPYSYFSSALRPAVTCGEETVRIGPGGYHAFVLPQGKVTCSIETSEMGDQVDIPADPRVHYIREEIANGLLTGHPHLNPIDHDVAQSEIQTCCVAETQSSSLPLKPGSP
jgi:hypothetical protein